MKLEEEKMQRAELDNRRRAAEINNIETQIAAAEKIYKVVEQKVCLVL